MTTLYQTLPKDLLCTSTLDEHKYVQKLNNNLNPSDDNYKKNLILAYMVRDLYYNGNLTVKELMNKHCQKLCLNPTKEQIKNKNQFLFMESIKNMVSTGQFPDQKISDYYESFLNAEETNTDRHKKIKYQLIMTMIEDNYDLEEIYDVFSVEELTYLGW